MPNKSVRWAFNFSKWHPSQSEMLLATSCVQPEERTRLSRFVFKNDFKSSLIGRLMMRKFVSDCTGQPYDEVRFVRDPKGKPLSLKKADVGYNVSHQGDFTVLAGVVGPRQLGVDVMKVEPKKNLPEYFRLMAKVFSPPEWDAIRGAGSEAAQLAMFCRHWCLKESYLKAVGVGITVDLREVRFEVNTEGLRKDGLVTDTEVYFKGEKLGWEFQEMLIDDDHCVAVALSGRGNDGVVFKEVSFDEVMAGAVALSEPDHRYCGSFFDKLDKGL